MKCMQTKCDITQLSHMLCGRIIDGIDYSKDISDEEVYIKIDDEILSLKERKAMSFYEISLLREAVFNSLRRLDVIQPFLDSDEYSEIMVNGGKKIFVEKNGSIYDTEICFESEDKLHDVIQKIVSGCNRSVNQASPIVDSRLQTGERINVVLPPISLDGAALTIRKFPKNPLTAEGLVELNTMSSEVKDYLEMLVKAHYNIFISGGTGSGKTTLLNVLSQFIPEDERIITIEDSAELKLSKCKNLIRLEARNGNIEGCNPITIRDLIKASLRMRPDRIIVGECRGEEALDMLQAMNTGHDGSLSTGHANTTKDMISRLETMVLCGSEIPLPAIRAQIAGAIDIFIHLSRMRDKSRKIISITEVEKYEAGEIVLNPIFQWDGESLRKVGRLHNTDKLSSFFDEDEIKDMIDEL